MKKENVALFYITRLMTYLKTWSGTWFDFFLLIEVVVHNTETPTQVFFCKSCKIFKTTFFYRTPPWAALVLTFILNGVSSNFLFWNRTDVNSQYTSEKEISLTSDSCFQRFCEADLSFHEGTHVVFCLSIHFYGVAWSCF